MQLGEQYTVPRKGTVAQPEGTVWLVVAVYGDRPIPEPVARLRVIGRTARTKHEIGFEMDVDAGWVGRDAVLKQPSNPNGTGNPNRG